jgi:hypothetical protein
MAGLVAAYWPQLSVVIRVAIGMLFSGALGLEREAKHKPAGLRTHMRMAAVASVLVALGPLMVEHLGSVIRRAVLRADPISLIGAVITGVSFLGAGTIIRGASGEQVEVCPQLLRSCWPLDRDVNGARSVGAGGRSNALGPDRAAWRERGRACTA